MNISRFITIDTLCIAAEVTAALLLLGFAIPERKKKEDDSGKLKDERDYLERQLRSCFVHETVLRSLNHLHSVQAGGNPVVSSPETVKETASLLGWQDRLTHLFNRTFVDLFLEEWAAWPEDQRRGSCLALLDLNDYSDLVRSKGAMGVEAILRETSRMLEVAFESNALIARYQPNRFALLTLHGSLATSYCELASFVDQLELCSKDPNSVLHEIGFSLCVSELGTEGKETPESWIESLDEGILESVESGHRLLSRQGDQWTTETPPLAPVIRARQIDTANQPQKNEVANEEPSGHPDAEAAADQPAIGTIQTSDEAESSSVPSSNKAPDASGDLNATPESPPAGTVSPSANDVSAVASDEDIAALFAQIQNKKPATQSQVNSSVATAPGNSVDGPVEPNSGKKSSTEDGADSIASSDDIAALFASQKMERVSNEPVPPSEPPAVDPSGLEALLGNLTDNASNEDIDSLFASVKPSAKPAPDVVDSATKPSVAPSGVQGLMGALTDNVSSDDIASLFASVQSGNTKQTATTPSPVPANEVQGPDPNGLKELLSNLEDSASADDISSLFASIKPNATQPQNERTAVPHAASLPAQGDKREASPVDPASTSSGIEALLDNLEDSVSSDDIASLFATVKPVSSKPKQSEAGSAGAAPSKPTVMDALNASISMEEVEDLFATINQGAPVTPPSKPKETVVSPAPDVDLKETASADDIAALFANLRKQ